MQSKKRFAVIGAGAVGGAFAAALTRSGHDVTITARGDHLQRIRAHGILLRGVWGDFDAPVHAVEVLPDGDLFDLVILAVKAQDAAAAIEQHRPLLERANILVVQNGLGSVYDTQILLPEAHISGGLAGLATSMLNPGIIEVTNLVTTYIGNDHNQDFAQQVCHLLEKSIPVEFLPNFTGALWTKLIVNCLNALPAITNLSMQELPETGLTRFVGISMAEAVRVAVQQGIRFAPLMGLTEHELLSLIDLDADLTSLPDRLISAMGPVPNLGSTLQSLRRGRPSEIDQLNGAIVRLGQHTGISTPMNSEIVRLVHDVEKNGHKSVSETFRALAAV